MESSPQTESHQESAKPAEEHDEHVPPETLTESNSQALIPFKGMTSNKHFYDTKPGESPYNAIDVCNSRESLVRQISPLEFTESSRVGEFTSSQWLNHHQDIAEKCCRMLEDSDRLRQDCRETSSQIRSKTETMQKETTKLLDERIRKTLDGRETLALQVERATQELHLLNKMKKKLQRALIALELPENNNQECFKIRRFRLGIDNTRDAVFYALAKESKVLRTGRNVLSKSFNEIQEAIFRLSEIKQLLEHDWSDKQETMQIDHPASKLQFRSNIAQFKPVSEALNEGTSNPSSWQDQIDSHMGTSDREMVTDSQLRAVADSALTEVTKDVLEAYEIVDSALNARISTLEIRLAELKSEDGQIRHEIGNQEESIKELRRQLEDKEPPLQVAQMRHYLRSFRPGIDRCLDPPHYSLKSELEELPKSINTLIMCIGRSEKFLEDFHREHEDLLKNIIGREHTLSLDTRCIIVRKLKPTANSLQGF